jgi:hypothetical protein
MSENEFDWNKLSPMAMWRDWVARSEAQWSEAAGKMLKDGRATGVMNRQVDEARAMQRMFAEMSQSSLAMANMPSRSDFEALDERMGRIEDGLATLSAEVSRLREAVAASGVTAADPRPTRTRKPAKATKPEGKA